MTSVLPAVLTAAVLHAGWNAIAKADQDRFGLFAKASVVSVAIGAVLAVVIAPPARPAWPWLLTSVFVHTLYNLGLMAAYQLGDFNQTYPLARGIGPLTVALVATFVLREPLPPLPTAGVVIIAAAIGVLGLTPWQRIRHNRPALVAAVLTGLAIATYTLLDGVGVRRSGSPIGYAAWLLAVHGVTTVVAVALIRRTRWAPAPAQRPARWRAATAAGVMSVLAYSLGAVGTSPRRPGRGGGATRKQRRGRGVPRCGAVPRADGAAADRGEHGGRDRHRAARAELASRAA